MPVKVKAKQRLRHRLPVNRVCGKGGMLRFPLLKFFESVPGSESGKCRSQRDCEWTDHRLRQFHTRQSHPKAQYGAVSGNSFFHLRRQVRVLRRRNSESSKNGFADGRSKIRILSISETETIPKSKFRSDSRRRDRFHEKPVKLNSSFALL